MTASGRRLRNGLDADETMWCQLECEDHESLSYSLAICFSFCSCKNVYTTSRYDMLYLCLLDQDPLDPQKLCEETPKGTGNKSHHRITSCYFQRCGVLLQRPQLQMQAFPWQSLVTWVTCLQLHPSGWWIFRSHSETSDHHQPGIACLCQQVSCEWMVERVGARHASNSMTDKQWEINELLVAHISKRTVFSFATILDNPQLNPQWCVRCLKQKTCTAQVPRLPPAFQVMKAVWSGPWWSPCMAWKRLRFFCVNLQPGGFGMVGSTAPLQFRWIYLDQSKGIFGHFSKVVFVVCAWYPLLPWCLRKRNKWDLAHLRCKFQVTPRRKWSAQESRATLEKWKDEKSIETLAEKTGGNLQAIEISLFLFTTHVWSRIN